MPAAPLEQVQNLADGSIASNANFFKPVYDAFKGLLGAAAGNPDANNGAPIIPRSWETGLLSFTNAQGITSNPGVSPGNVFDDVAAHSVTVPVGQMLIVDQIATNASTVSQAPVTINDGTNVTQVSALNPSAQLSQRFPFVLDQNWIFTTPAHSGWWGYYVLRDTAVTPVARQITNSSTYAVPNGKTLWVYGVVALTGVTIYLQAGGANVALAAYSSGNTGAGNGNGIGGPPIPFGPGTVLSSSSASAVSFWGVLI